MMYFLVLPSFTPSHLFIVHTGSYLQYSIIVKFIFIICAIVFLRDLNGSRILQ